MNEIRKNYAPGDGAADSGWSLCETAGEGTGGTSMHVNLVGRSFAVFVPPVPSPADQRQ